MLWNAVIFGWASWQYSQVFTRPNPGTRESLTLFLVCERSWTWVWFSLIPSPSMIGDLGTRLGMINNLSTGPLASFPYHRTYCEDTKYFFIQNLSKNLEMGLDKRSASKVSSAFRMLCNKNCGWAWKQGYTISAHRATIIRPLSQAVTWVLHSPEPKAWPKKIWKISLIGCGTKLMGSAGLTILLVFHHSCDLLLVYISFWTQSKRYTIWRWHFQVDNAVHRRVPKQTSYSALCV